MYWFLFLLRLHNYFPDQNTDENDLSDDDNGDGLLFKLDGDDRGFDGIFEEQ